MKLNKRNKKELTMISMFLLLIAAVFFWIVENIGLPIETKIEAGRVQVIDVSSYNGTINWKKVKDKQINHAILKIGSGINAKRKGSEDSKFASNFKSGGYAAIRRGVYYYSYATTVKDAQKEAKHCLSLLKKHGIAPSDLDLPVAFDIEEDAAFQTGRDNVTKMTEAFCEEIEKAGFTPMVYSNASSLKNYFIYGKIKKYKLWVAHYTDADHPDVPFDFQIWQYTDQAFVPGANTGRGTCDLNYYLVDKEGNGI